MNSKLKVLAVLLLAPALMGGCPYGMNASYSGYPFTNDYHLSIASSYLIPSIRITVRWDVVQPYSAADFDISSLTPLVDAAVARHMQILMVFQQATTPGWARGSKNRNCSNNKPEAYPPKNDTDFGTFAGRIALAFKGKIEA